MATKARKVAKASKPKTAKAKSKSKAPKPASTVASFPPPLSDLKRADYYESNGVLIAWDKVPLGDYEDKPLAKFLSCTPVSVANHRRRRGIPPYRKRAK